MSSEKSINLNGAVSEDSKILNTPSKTPSVVLPYRTLPNSFYKSKYGKELRKLCSTDSLKCYKCSRKFSSRPEVVAHLKLLHNACAFPDCRYLTNFKMHSSVCKYRALCCAVCSQEFTDKSLLLAHFNEHIDAAFYVCEVCRKGFQQQADLLKHSLQFHDKSLSIPTEAVHPKTVYQKCDRCQEYFKLFSEFEEHVSSCNSSSYACSICHVIFSNLASLEKHTSVEHKLLEAVKGHAALRQGKRYFCGVCYLGFFDGYILKKHLLSHKIEVNFICDVCHANFDCDGDLQSHYMEHIEEYYVLHDLIRRHLCNSCKKVFETHEQLKYHLILKDCTQVKESADTNGYTVCSKERSDDDNTALETEILVPFDTSEIPVYALKSGEDLLNCEDSKCVIVMDLESLFVLQMGICASENRMPDVKNSEAYNENDVIDAVLLQNHMLQILYADNANSLPNTEQICNSPAIVESSCGDPMEVDQNFNTNSGIVENTLNESNDDSMKYNVVGTESLPVIECEASVNSDNTNEAFDYLAYNTMV